MNFKFLLFIGFALFAFTNLHAHQRSESFSKWSIVESKEDVNVSVVFTVKLSVLSKIFPNKIKDWESFVTSEVLNGFVIKENCIEEENIESFISPQNNSFNIAWTYKCDQPLTNIVNNTFFDQDPSHSHIARFSLHDMVLPEVLFTESSRSATFKVKSTENKEITSFQDYFILGINHIASGFDHIAFLLGLILLNRHFKSLLLAITGFTLGHSLTLALGVLGIVTPMSNWVEAVIGFSIALIALEALSKETTQFVIYTKGLFFFWGVLFFLMLVFGFGGNLLGFIGLCLFSISYFLLVTLKKINLSLFVTTLFGLVHGFGFGGYLSEIGFSEGRFFNALLGFNLGVEAGQIAILIVLIGTMILLNKTKIKYEGMRAFMACLLISVGTFWFLERSF